MKIPTDLYRFFKTGLVVKPIAERRSMIDRDHAGLSIARQCGLLEVNRSGLYYKAKFYYRYVGFAEKV